MKRVLSLFIASLAGAVCVTAGCGNGSLLDSENIGTLSLSSVHHLHDGSALAADGSGAKVLTNNLGFQITLTHASVGYRSLALVSSGTDPECVGGNDVTIVINGSDDLLAEDLIQTSLGEHTIPLASFCSYELVLGPSEEPAALKFHAGEVHGAHAAFHVQGTWSKGGGAETAFEIESEETVTASGVFEHPLHFHKGETETAKSFGVSYDVLFNGIDFGTDDASTVLAEVASNLAGAVDIHGGH